MNDGENRGDNSGTDSGLAETRDYDIEIFTEELKNLPCLWNSSAVSYKDRSCKINAWRKHAQMFNKDGKLQLYFLSNEVSVFKIGLGQTLPKNLGQKTLLLYIGQGSRPWLRF